MTDTAILHDKFVTHGGSERVGIEMARTLDAPIYTARVDGGVVPEDIDVHCITSSRMGRMAMRGPGAVKQAYQSLRWQSVSDLQQYDVVVENKTNCWWYVPRDGQAVVRYVHSPPRGLFDQFNGGGLAGRGLSLMMRAAYQQTTPYADHWLCNSELVERRTQQYLGVADTDTDVVYPPVDTESYGSEYAASERDYYLSLSRLDGWKRVETVVRAFNGLDKRVVVAGEGPRRSRLESIAGPNVDIIGYIDEQEKRRRLAECKGVIVASVDEDFGLVPIEAMASGTPVVGVNEGFTKFQITDGANGVLWSHGVEELRQAIGRFERDGVGIGAEGLQAFAKRFDIDQFRESLKGAVDEAALDRLVSLSDPEAATREVTEAVR